jgi:bifunctional UDP-N-acetylglucosamine pyrophosphorylase/glucosamine-1-phosphate N-acetyltransferase
MKQSITKAVILAAGEGTRMHPLTYTRSKVMLPLANKPILEHVVIEMQQAGIREFVFVVGYHNEQIRSYFGGGEKWGVSIQYCSQKEHLGTADALRNAEGFISENFFMANGDAIINHQDIMQLTGRTGNVLSVIELQDVSGLGVIEGKAGEIIRICEKMQNPPSHLANAGLYLFTTAIFEAIKRTDKSPRGEYEITDSIQLMIDDGQTVAYHEIPNWLDFSYPWDLLTANERVLAKLEPHSYGEIESNVVMKGSVSVGKGTTIKSGSYIIGPVVIGQNCEIGPNCYIRPSTVIADNCHVGAAVEVKNSIVMAGSKIPHLTCVGDSIIGENCNLGAGTKIANLRLDKQHIRIDGIDTKKRKLGAIIGDKVETGINSSINVGTMIGNNTNIGPGALAHGIIPPGSKIL